MAFIPTPLTAKIAIRGRLFGNDVVNTLWVERTDETEWTASSLGTLAGNIEEWWATDLVPQLSANYSLADITTTAQFAATAPAHVRVPASPIVGGNVSSSLPGSCCFTITFLSDARGRSFRGRNYISGIPVGDADDNFIEESFAVGIRSAYASLELPMAVTGCQHVVCSHYADNAPRATGVTVPVTGYRYHDLNMDSQRRRLNGRGS